MAIVPNGFVHQQHIADGVRRAEARLAPDVIRIRFSLGAEWSGAEAIFFRVVLFRRRQHSGEPPQAHAAGEGRPRGCRQAVRTRSRALFQLPKRVGTG